MKRLFLLMIFLAVSIQSDAAKMSSYTNNTTPNGDVYFVGVDPNDISQTANGSNYRYSLNSILNLGLLDAVFNSLSIAGTGDSWIELENNTSFSDSIAGKYGLRFYNGALQQIINGTATDIGSASVIQRSSDPVYTDLSTGQIAVSTSSGDLFIKTSTGMYTIAGTYAADPSPPAECSTPVYTYDEAVVLRRIIGRDADHYYVGMKYNSVAEHTICSVTANMLYDSGAVSNNTYTMRIYTNSSGNLGTLIASSTGVTGSVSWNNTPVSFDFTSRPTLSASTDYFIVCDIGSDASTDLAGITYGAFNGKNESYYFRADKVIAGGSMYTFNMTVKE